MRGSRLDRRRLALVVDRFASSHAGERLAALEAAGRILAAGGLSWRELIAEAAEDSGKDEPVEAHHYHRIRELLIEGRDVLTAWEKQFLTGLLGFLTLSEKQRALLASITRKVSVAVAVHEASA